MNKNKDGGGKNKDGGGKNKDGGDFDSDETIKILAQLSPQKVNFSSSKNFPLNDPKIYEKSDSSSNEDEESDEYEYVYIVQDPKTGEEIEINRDDVPPDTGGSKIYYNPLKRTLFLTDQPKDEAKPRSIIDDLNMENNILPVSSNQVKDSPNSPPISPRVTNSYISTQKIGKNTGDNEIIKVLGSIARKIRSNNIKARIYKHLNYGVNLMVVALSVAVGFMLSVNKGSQIILAIMSFGIALIKGIHELFKLGTLGIVHKTLANRLQSLYRDVQEAREILVTNEEKKRYAGMIVRQLDQLDLEMFKASYGPKEVKDVEEEEGYLPIDDDGPDFKLSNFSSQIADNSDDSNNEDFYEDTDEETDNHENISNHDEIDLENGLPILEESDEEDINKKVDHIDNH